MRPLLRWLFVLPGLIAGFLACFVSVALAQETPPPKPTASKADAAAAKGDEKKAPESFIRVTRNEKGSPLTMDTAVATYVTADGKHPDVTIDLIGAVHIGEKGYYDELNKKFEQYEVLLFELVAPPNTKIPKGAKGNSAHPIAALQTGMKSMLGLEHQLECVDYTKANFVHADMSPDEFNESMKNRGESFSQMILKAIGAGMAQQATGGSAGTSDFELLSAMFSKNRAQKLRLAMAGQFENMESQVMLFDGPDGSTILTERNRKAFEVLAKQLEAGKKNIGVFYGAAHLPDMEKRLAADFGMKRKELTWMKAWTLAEAKPAGEAVPKPEEKKPAATKAEDQKPAAVE